MQLEWKDHYSVGNEHIDQEHKELLQLAKAAVAAQDKSSYQLAAMQLYRHFRIDFAHEESLMREVKYPDIKQHSERHLGMLSRLNEISESIGQDRWDKDVLGIFMRESVIPHFLDEDFKVANHIRKSVG